ncbi:MAG: hypothetical protein JW738_00385 [Actinobacteria bacterium]|nr:hypothetical protein [Actinomycetota bacterium]
MTGKSARKRGRDRVKSDAGNESVPSRRENRLSGNSFEKEKRELFGLLPFFGEWRRAPLMENEEPENCNVDKNAGRRINITLDTGDGKVFVENYISNRKLKRIEIDEGICMFSRGNLDKQKEALVNVSKMDGGNVIAGTLNGRLISYVGIHHPLPRQRWGKQGYDWLYELGAIEVSRNYRAAGLGGAMMEAAFQDPVYDDAIVFTTGFTWHWDLEGAGLDKMEYRLMGAKLFSKYGFVEMETDEPNVAMDSANIFMVRVGEKVPFSRKREFASLLFTNEWESLRRESPGLK